MKTRVFLHILTTKSIKTRAFSSDGAYLGMNFNPFSIFLALVFDVRKIIKVPIFCIKVCIWTGKLKPPDKARGDKNIVIYVEIDAGSSKLAPRLFYYLVTGGPLTNPRVQKSSRFVRVFNIIFLYMDLCSAAMLIQSLQNVQKLECFIQFAMQNVKKHESFYYL